MGFDVFKVESASTQPRSAAEVLEDSSSKQHEDGWEAGAFMLALAVDIAISTPFL